MIPELITLLVVGFLRKKGEKKKDKKKKKKDKDKE